ncbi:PaaI family thioesterase [Fundidesulfovibrio butyratiphilus]
MGDLIGFRIARLEGGTSLVEFTADHRHTNPMGTVHGGILCDIGDAAMGAALASIMPDDASFTTLELKMNFLRPVWKGPLRSEGRVIKAGRTVSLTECDIFDEQNHLVAHGTSTLMTLQGDQAQGRRLPSRHEGGK